MAGMWSLDTAITVKVHMLRVICGRVWNFENSDFT